MNTPPSRRSLFYSQLLSGVGIGLLLGIIIGLSVSPVVKTILGALAGLLAAFLGLQESLFSKQEETPEKVANRMYFNGVRAAAFGFATVIALLIGMYMRTHGVLSITIEKQVKNWTDAGVDPPLAQELVIYEKFKLFKKEGALHIDTAQAKLAAEKNNAGDGFLFNKESMINYCDDLDIASIYNDHLGNALSAFKLKGGDFEKLALALELVDENSQRSLIASVRSLVCFLKIESNEVYEGFCKGIQNNINYSDISNSLSDLGSSTEIMEVGQLTVAILNASDEDGDRKEIAKAIFSMICPD